jgi:DNA-binding NtrC family response regulator
VQKKGGPRAERLDLRLIAASSASLEAAVHEGRFSRDLYELMARTTLHLPRLADRKEDVEPLARHFLGRFGVARHVHAFSDDVAGLFRQYDWPGNMAELEDCLDQACALASNGVIEIDDLPRGLRDAHTKLAAHDIIPAKRSPSRVVEGTHSVAGLPERELEPQQPLDLGGRREPRAWDISDEDPVSLDLYEKKALLRALDQVDGDKLAAAKLLKVGKSTLYRKLKRFGIT